MGNDLARLFADAAVDVLQPTAFEPSNLRDATLDQIRRSGVRIVALLADNADKAAVASRARQRGMTSAGWAWIRSDDLEEDYRAVPAMQARPNPARPPARPPAHFETSRLAMTNMP